MRKSLISILFVASVVFLINPMIAVSKPISSHTNPESKRLLAAMRSTNAIQKLATEWKDPLVLTRVNNRVSKSWAWVEASPATTDGKQHFEPVSGVMQRENGKWELVQWLPDTVSAADDPRAAFHGWCKQFVKDHPGCPATIFPTKL